MCTGDKVVEDVKERGLLLLSRMARCVAPGESDGERQGGVGVGCKLERLGVCRRNRSRAKERRQVPGERARVLLWTG
jgi:hypothetical protein